MRRGTELPPRVLCESKPQRGYANEVGKGLSVAGRWDCRRGGNQGGVRGGRSPPPRALGEHRIEGALIMSTHTRYTGILSLCIVGTSACVYAKHAGGAPHVQQPLPSCRALACPEVQETLALLPDLLIC